LDLIDWGKILKAGGTIGAVALVLSRCGGLYNCYDAAFIGSSTYYLTVQDKRSNSYREMHSYNSDFVFSTLTRWKRGDDLVVCNASIVNTTRHEDLPCGDFGCLALWPLN
jgi:hypothetical protein